MFIIQTNEGFNRSLQARRESLLPRTAWIDLDVEEVP